jgi:predicted site-specific integrase-resolvase
MTGPRRLGYARVSTYGQTLDAQLDQLRKAGCSKIFREKVTGARADRRELLKTLKAVATRRTTSRYGSPCRVKGRHDRSGKSRARPRDTENLLSVGH